MKSECSEKSKLQTILGYLTALQLLHNLAVGFVNFPVGRNTKALVLSFEGEIYDYNVETNFAHLNLWVCMFLFLCNLGWIQLSGG